MGLFDLLFNLGGLADGITPKNKKKTDANTNEAITQEEPDMLYCPVCRKKTVHKHVTKNKYRCSECKNLTEL